MNELKNIFKEYYTLNDIGGILFWDNATYLPQGSSESRSEQLAVLSKLTDKTLRSDKIESIINSIVVNNLSDFDKKNFILMKNIIRQENSVDPLLKEKLTRKKIQCEQAWRLSKEKNDISIVKDLFNDVLALTKEEAKQLSSNSTKSPYDSLINKYDMDLSSKTIDDLFSVIRNNIIPTYLNINKIHNTSIPSLHMTNSDLLSEMKIFLKALKFDFNRGRIDLSSHPFCGGANNDIRITTRFEKNVLEYFMHPSYSLTVASYLSILFDRKGHRGTYSWLSRQMIQSKKYKQV